MPTPTARTVWLDGTGRPVAGGDLCGLFGRVEDSDCIYDSIAAALIEGGKACVKLGWAGLSRPGSQPSKSPPVSGLGRVATKKKLLFSPFIL